MPRSTPRASRSALRGLLVALVSLLPALGLASSAHAEDYPLPTHQIGGVNHTVFRVGDLVVFTGDGYLVTSGSQQRSSSALRSAALAPSATGMTPGVVTITDNGKPLGTAKVDDHGAFRYSFRYTSSATLGKHVLVGRGVGANTAARDTTAVIYLVGVSLTLPRTDGSSGTGGGQLAFTGVDIVRLVLVGLACIGLGALLVVRNLRARDARRRARRERRAAVA